MVMAVQILVWHSISKAGSNRATTGQSSQTVGAMFRDKLRGNWVRGNWEADDGEEDHSDAKHDLVALPGGIPLQPLPHAVQNRELPPLPPAPADHVDSVEAAGPAHTDSMGGGKGVSGEAGHTGSAPQGPTGELSAGLEGAHLHEGPAGGVVLQQTSGVPGHDSSRQRDGVAALHEVPSAPTHHSGGGSRGGRVGAWRRVQR